MGHLGFSFVGLLWLCILIVPNLLWARSRPLGYDPSGENRILAALEKAGQAGVVCTVLFSMITAPPCSRLGACGFWPLFF